MATASFADEAVYKLQRAEAQAPYELLLVDGKSGGAEFVREARRITAQRSGTELLVATMVGQPGREKAEVDLQGLPSACVVVKPVTPSRLFDAIVGLQHGSRRSASRLARRSSTWPTCCGPSAARVFCWPKTTSSTSRWPWPS